MLASFPIRARSAALRPLEQDDDSYILTLRECKFHDHPGEGPPTVASVPHLN
jgi:hypothetical protein